jgi:hypothetical protein
MNNRITEKQAIRDYVRIQNDQVLATLTAITQDGGLKFMDACKCIRGVVGGGTTKGYLTERSTLALGAEQAMANIGLFNNDDDKRNRIIYAICRAEQKRREWAKREEEQVREVESEELHA